MGNREIPMIFIGYAKNHAGGCYSMHHTNTVYLTVTRDITWLHCMYYGKPETNDEVVIYLPHGTTSQASRSKGGYDFECF